MKEWKSIKSEEEKKVKKERKKKFKKMQKRGGGVREKSEEKNGPRMSKIVHKGPKCTNWSKWRLAQITLVLFLYVCLTINWQNLRYYKTKVTDQGQFPGFWFRYFFFTFFGDIFRFGNMSVLVTFQFWWHFSFNDISV